MNNNSPCILIDGSSYFFRAYHALPPLKSPDNEPTGAMYGVINMVRKLMKDYNPTNIAIVFDAKGKTFRNEWFAEYKAHRPPMPDDLICQFEPLCDFLKSMGIPVIIVEGVEADDVIGTLSHEATTHKKDVLISTSDKDIAQLVNDHVTLINTMSGLVLTPNGVVEKFGVTPHQMIDYLTLVGDTSDNIPGVTKCGPKTAVKWLSQYGSLDNLVQHTDEITGKIGEYLRAAIEHLPLSKKLVTIKTDVELPVSLEECKLQPANQEHLFSLAKQYGFTNWIKEFEPKKNTTSSNPQNYQIIDEFDDLKKWLSLASKAKLLSVDTETTSLNTQDAELVGVSMAIDDNPPVYIPLAHQTNDRQIDFTKALELLKPVLENKHLKKVGQNIKYDLNILKKYDIALDGIEFDTMLESYVYNSSANRHDLDTLAKTFLDHTNISFDDVAGTGSKKKRFDEISIEKAAPYAAEDAEITLKLHHALYPKLDDKLLSVFHDIEMPLVSVLASMERKGVLIDIDTLKKQGDNLKKRLEELQSEAYQLAGKTFNLQSPKQLQTILYEEQNLPILAKTPKGQPSTAESVLQTLAMDHKIAAVIIEHRTLSKLVSTYIDALPKRINQDTKRVHTSYNQAITATGRLSSSEPNLQNIPIRTKEGRAIRQAFIAPEKHSLIAADYSQIELRIMAHLSQDKNLIKAFANNLDIHQATASEIFHISLEKVSEEQRRQAKAVNFGLIYGMSAFGLAKQLQISREEAQHYIDRYFERYPAVLNYMEDTRNKAKKDGYVETVFGRRLYLPDILSKNGLHRKAAERTAINAPMQGTAADIIKKAMIAMYQEQLNKKLPATMLMQVHDELIFEVHDDNIETTTDVIRQHMENNTTLSVPLIVSIGIGENWDEAH